MTRILSPLLALTLGLLLTLALSAAPQTAPATTGEGAKIKVLLLDGYSNHNWKLNTQLLRGILEPTNLFDITVSTAPPSTTAPNWNTWRPKFTDYDVILQTCNDFAQRPAPKWPDPVKTDFVNFIKSGGGVLIFHSANNAFPDWPEYNDIIGLGWRPASYGTALQMSADGTITRIPPGQGRATGHATRADVLVHTFGDHPIHAGLPKTWKTPMLEVYYYTRGPAQNVEILSYGLDPQYKNYWPLEWTVQYGQGRVYASCFGHVWSNESPTSQPVNLLAADEQILLQRALQWLAKRPITIPVPKDFPTAESTSLRPPIPLPK